MRERWNSAQPNDGTTFEQMIRWQIENVKAKLSQRLQSLNVVGIHIRMKHYHSYMSHDVTMWSFDMQTANLLGIQTRMSGYYSFIFKFHFTFHAKLIKPEPLKLRWWKFSFLEEMISLIIWYLDKWRASNQIMH